MRVDDLYCPSCGTGMPAVPVPWCCPACRGVIEFRPTELDRRADLRGSGVWRYLRWLRLGGAPDLDPITLGEPETPLIQVPWGASEVAFKLEAALPTGSFKDRGAAVLVAWLRHNGVRSVVEDSSGNAGAALAAYCARAGISCTVYVPAAASPAKLAQLRAYGARVETVPGPREAATEAAVAGAAAAGAVYASHLWNPAFLAGTATFAYEAWEQLGRRVPDVAVFPVGGGTLLLGAYRGWVALREAGLADRVPRLVGVQVAACAPLAAGFDAGLDAPAPVNPRTSAAEGILTPRPPRGSQVLAAVRETAGCMVTVDDEATRAALRDLGRLGIYAEPTAAVAAAGLRTLLESGGIAADDQVVCALTGSGLKTTHLATARQ
jgi:threonine synthase